jgi:membrane-associated protease RseP (regulator of RpoE activity)
MSDPISSLPTTADSIPPVQVWVTRPHRQRYWLHILLLVLTISTTLLVGTHFQYNYQHGLPPLADDDNSSIPFFPVDLVWTHPSRLLDGIPFSASLMLILLAHEMGHYLMCVRYGVDATLPFFIPFPSLIGTMGAFIRIRSPIRSRIALFDIGIAGPIAGFVVACVVLLLALGASVALPAGPPPTEGILIHYPWIFTLAQRLLGALGILHGAAATSPLERLALHPMAFAAWGGMFATSLNLLPGGQLDGGHIVFSIAPRVHRFISRVVILVLIPMAVYLWWVWLIWAILLEISSFRHPHVAEWPKVSGMRLGLAVFALLMLIITLIPKPIALMIDGHDRSSLKAVVHSFRRR